MAEEKQLIAPRVPTPAPESRVTGSQPVPEDLLSEHVQRLAVLTLAGAGLWTVGVLMDTIVMPGVLGITMPRITVVIEVLAIVASVLAFGYLKYSTHAACTKADAGLAYMVLSAIAVAFATTLQSPPKVELTGHLSWNVIVILVCAMIAPSSPRKMLAATLLSATTDPLAMWLAHLRGLETPGPVASMMIFVPNYACAIVAVWPSFVLRHISGRLREARDLGAYELIELLGHGGMGEVWRARHRLLARSAAIKLVRPELLGAANEAEAKTMTRRFAREAQATAALSSPHTINIFDYGSTQDGTFYYVMELLAGRDLESLVREFGPVPADRVVYLLRQACHSLADAHARGLVHRDIKPANIYVCRMGLEYDFVKVLDFGLVKYSDNRTMQQTMMTAEHTTTGTPAFMAPEVILGEREVDARADVYAIGCVAYYLLTGELVFEADTPMKMFLHHVQTPPVPPSQRTELPIPPELDALVMACLEKNPDRRPQDARQLFSLACDCRMLKTWDNEAARVWWEKHLLELTRPLTLADPADEPRHAVAIH
jgi:serine/threonine protein kinase